MSSSVPFPSYPHEVLAVVVSVRRRAQARSLEVLLWRRGDEPEAGRWALPGGGVRSDQRLREAVSDHLAAKVDMGDIAWLEQVATHSRVDRDPRARVLATGYLAIAPPDACPALPGDTAWFPVDELPATAFDHHYLIAAAIDRLRAKLSYTNIGFALAPAEFTVQQLREVVVAALGYDVSATNLHRVMSRRHMIEPTGERSPVGPGGGRPASLYRFTTHTVEVTDPFAVLKPPATPPGEPATR